VCWYVCGKRTQVLLLGQFVDMASVVELLFVTTELGHHQL
jgi:hypothetical protein